jgi:copper chaperone CopZ
VTVRETRGAERDAAPTRAEAVRYRVTGMDCAHDAAEIERAARAVAGVEAVKVSVATQIMTARVTGRDVLPEIERAVGGIGYRVDRLGEREGTPAATRDGDAAALGPAVDVPPAYRRALWTVVLLNLGYGVVEAVGGLVSRSQALRADALDFLGDGLITFLALLATGRSLAWRARAALIQGVFLGALGVGVIVSTAYRVLVQRQPEAELMGVFGAAALLVNVVAALVLLPYRRGHDSSARAVWRFSAADAVGNAATVAAAGLVAWTDTPWPDLGVAVAVASLFLRASWAIIRDARADLREELGRARRPAPTPHRGSSAPVSGRAPTSSPSAPELVRPRPPRGAP